MPNQIKQIQASYHPLEDRILFKLHTDGQQKIHAWMTRRYIKLLIPILQGQHPKTGEPMLQDSQQVIEQMAQDKAQMDSDFESEYVEPESAETPLGETPILLAKITFKGLTTDNPQLLLEPEQGSGISLSYNAQLTGTLIKLFSFALKKADWSLELTPILELPENTTLQ